MKGQLLKALSLSLKTKVNLGKYVLQVIENAKSRILPLTALHHSIRQKVQRLSLEIALPFPNTSGRMWRPHHLMPNYLKVVVGSSSKKKFAMYEQKSALKCILSTMNNVEKRGCALARGHPGGGGPLDPPYVFLQNPMISRVINIRWVAEKKHKDGVTNHTTISGFL